MLRPVLLCYVSEMREARWFIHQQKARYYRPPPPDEDMVNHLEQFVPSRAKHGCLIRVILASVPFASLRATVELEGIMSYARMDRTVKRPACAD